MTGKRQRTVRRPTILPTELPISSIKLTKIAYSHGAKVQFTKYNSIDVHLMVEAAVEEGDDPSQILRFLQKMVHDEIEQAAEDRAIKMQEIKARLR